MEDKPDIHNFARRFEQIENKIKDSKEISTENKRIISRFTDRCFKDNLSYAAVVKYLYALYDIAKWTGKNFTSLTQKDLDKMFRRLETGEIKSKPIYKKIKGKKVLVRQAKKYGTAVIRNRKVALSRLFGIKHGIIKKPKLLENMKFGSDIKEIVPDDLWTMEEKLKLIGAGSNSRDMCFLAILCETGARIGEIVPLQIKNIVEQEDNIIELRTAVGKTGARPIYLYWSVPYIRKWLGEHPDANRNNFLFPQTFGKLNLSEHIGYNSFRKILIRARKKCGINKPCNPHNFRHSAVTEYNKNGGNTEASKLLFWGNPRTDMLSRYTHLKEEDVKRDTMRVLGIKPKKNVKNEVRPCPKCHVFNPCRIEEELTAKGVAETVTFLTKNCSSCEFTFDIKEREIIRQNKQQEIENQIRERAQQLGAVQSPDMINVVWDLLKLVKFKDKKSEAKVNKVLNQYKMKYFRKSNVKVGEGYESWKKIEKKQGVPILDQHA